MNISKITITESAIADVKRLGLPRDVMMKLADRLESAIRNWDGRDCTLICDIKCTDGEWKRFKDSVTRTRTAFSLEDDRAIVQAILPRDGLTYQVIKVRWRAEKNFGRFMR